VTTTAAPLARCPVKACPVRYATGRDRACAEHGADDDAVFRAAMELGIEQTPGDRGDGQHDGADTTRSA
jgi:hypothetical protein